MTGRCFPLSTVSLLSAMLLSPLMAAAADPRPPPPTLTSRGGVGDLLVAPTRLVFEARSRSAEVTLINIGTQTATYRISFVQMRMAETGALQEVAGAGPDERFADHMIRFSPRQVTLAPHVAQTVRLQVRKPADLAAGEYRSHLLFRAVPPAATAEASSEPSPGIQIALTQIYGVTIPVIVRHGETAAQVSLSNLSLGPPSRPDETAVLHLAMNRSGDRSVYGNLAVTFTPTGGPAVVVGLMNGVAVYDPNPLRLAAIPLRPPLNVKLGAGNLHVRYANPESPTHPFAEAYLAIP